MHTLFQPDPTVTIHIGSSNGLAVHSGLDLEYRLKPEALELGDESRFRLCGTDPAFHTLDEIGMVRALSRWPWRKYRCSARLVSRILPQSSQTPLANIAYFANVQPADYWSSTGYAFTSDTSDFAKNGAWFCDFNTGEVRAGSKDDNRYACAVRGSSSTMPDRFMSNGDGTVTDRLTGLMWQQETASLGNYENAIRYCRDLTLAGHDDWRLPSINELQSIADYERFGPSINTRSFPGTSGSAYWSSTSFESSIWHVYFNVGSVSRGPMTDSLFVRAVRGGQDRIPDNLFIHAPVQGSQWIPGERMEIQWEPENVTEPIAIQISREAGRSDTFEPIAESTENDGEFSWTVSGPSSANCVLKVEPAMDPSKAAVLRLFSVRHQLMGDVDGNGTVDLSDAILSIQLAGGMTNQDVVLSSDADGDGKIGLGEAIYVLQELCGIRSSSEAP